MAYREWRAGDPLPPAGMVLEVGSVPDPERGRSGDLITFVALGGGRFAQHRNRSPRTTEVGVDTVEFWAPLRVVAGPDPLTWVQAWPAPRLGAGVLTRAELGLASAAGASR